MKYLKKYEGYSEDNTIVNLSTLYDETSYDVDITECDDMGCRGERYLYSYPTFENKVKDLLTNNVISFHCYDCGQDHKGYCSNVYFFYNREGEKVEGFDRIGLELLDIPLHDHSIDMLSSMSSDKKVVIHNKETKVYNSSKRFDL